MPTKRQRAVKAARDTIEQDGHATCVCGQLLLSPEEYVDHCSTCAHAARGEQARTSSDFEKD